MSAPNEAIERALRLLQDREAVRSTLDRFEAQYVRWEKELHVTFDNWPRPDTKEYHQFIHRECLPMLKRVLEGTLPTEEELCAVMPQSGGLPVFGWIIGGLVNEQMTRHLKKSK